MCSVQSGLQLGVQDKSQGKERGNSTGAEAVSHCHISMYRLVTLHAVSHVILIKMVCFFINTSSIYTRLFRDQRTKTEFYFQKWVEDAGVCVLPPVYYFTRFCQLIFFPTCAFCGASSSRTMLIHKGHGYTVKASTTIKTTCCYLLFQKFNDTVMSERVELCCSFQLPP